MNDINLIESEEWRRIVSAYGIFSERYEVSSLGRVRANPLIPVGGSRRFRVLFQGKDNKGYAQVYLHYGDCKKMTLKVHRLVAESFLGYRDLDMTVNHIDGNKDNNTATNLEYVSNQENCRHAHRVISGRSHVVVHGERMSFAEAIDRFGCDGMKYFSAKRRVNRHGWDVMRAITTPLMKAGRPSGSV